MAYRAPDKEKVQSGREEEENGTSKKELNNKIVRRKGQIEYKIPRLREREDNKYYISIISKKWKLTAAILLYI